MQWSTAADRPALSDSEMGKCVRIFGLGRGASDLGRLPPSERQVGRCVASFQRYVWRPEISKALLKLIRQNEQLTGCVVDLFAVTTRVVLELRPISLRWTLEARSSIFCNPVKYGICCIMSELIYVVCIFFRSTHKYIILFIHRFVLMVCGSY